MQISVFLVVAQDHAAYAALDALAPGHVALSPHLVPEEAGYARPGSKQMRQVSLEPLEPQSWPGFHCLP